MTPTKQIEQRIIEKVNWATKAWQLGDILLSEYIEELSQVKEMSEVLNAFDEEDDWESFVEAIWLNDGMSDKLYQLLK